jgi:hypothetical protein
MKKELPGFGHRARTATTSPSTIPKGERRAITVRPGRVLGGLQREGRELLCKTAPFFPEEAQLITIAAQGCLQCEGFA